MTVSFADVLLVVIVIFGVYSLFRGVRAVALTTAAIFFAIVVVIFSSGLVVAAFRRLGVPLDTVDTQDLFTIGVFIFTVLMSARVLGRLVSLPAKELTGREKLWGFVLGLVNGFMVMALIEHYLADAMQATSGSRLSVGLPALAFSHPSAATWSVSLIASTFTLLPPAPTTDLWSKLPVALVLLLLFLAFVFVGTIYGRFSRSRG